MDLTPRDDNGLSDPFVIVQFGKHKPINDKVRAPPPRADRVLTRRRKTALRATSTRVLPRD